MTALIDSEYESTCTPDLAKLDEYSSRKALWLELWQSLNNNSLAIVVVACLKLLADSADSMDLANWSQSRA